MHFRSNFTIKFDFLHKLSETQVNLKIFFMSINRRMTAAAGAAVLLSSLESIASTTATSHSEGQPVKKLKVALIGCGSVSNRYIPHLQTSKLIEIVSLCDIKYDRALAINKEYKVGAQTYPNIDAMLAGVPLQTCKRTGN
jgi:glutamyl-tRNA reductase